MRKAIKGLNQCVRIGVQQCDTVHTAITYLLTYLLTSLLTYLLTFFLPSLHTYFLISLLTYFLTYLFTYLFTYLLTPWGRVHLEKLTGFATSQEIPRIYGTRKFITVLASARHLSLSWARSIQSPQPPPTSWRSLLILPSHLRLGLPNGLRILILT
jgi:hypothetical protein